MKVLFFIALLVNIVFFLWEFNSGGLNSSLEIAGVDSHKTKQILLVSELPSQDERNSVTIAENNMSLDTPVDPSELDSTTNSKQEEDVVVESSTQLIESISTSIEEFFENVISSDKLFQYDQIEQITQENDTDILASDGQVDSVLVGPIPEEKPLAVDGLDEVIIDNLLNNDKPNVEQADSEKNYCYHIGPFADHDALNVWHKVNKIDADSVSRLNKDSKVVSDYLVYYPAAEIVTESRNITQILKQQGITDSWLIRKGKLKGAISIALFVKKNRALSLQEKLVKVGMAAEIKERSKIEPLLYAKISTKDKAFKDTVIISDKQAVSECENNTGKQE